MSSINKSVIISIIGLIATNAALGVPQRRALIIGNDTYAGGQLKNARNDAKAIAQQLAALGYITTLELDANRKKMSELVDSFANALQVGDTALIYYSGHGMQMSGENYLIPVDFRLASMEDVRQQAYPLSFLLKKLVDHGATTQIVILDACRDNPFLASRSLRVGWAPMLTSEGTFLAFGTAPGSTASDNPHETHGLFTKAVLKYLANSSLDINTLFQRVREDVIQESHSRQIPWVASSLIGSLHINPKLDLEASAFALPATGSANSESSTNAMEGDSRALSPAAVSSPSTDQAIATSVSSKIALNSAPILIKQGILLALQKNYDEAVRSLNAAIAADPTSGIALRVLGLIFNLMGRGAEATQSLNRAVSISPSDSPAYYYRCLALSSSDPLSAVRDCEASIGLQPGAATTHLALSQALLSLGQTERALAEATKALQLDSSLSLGYAMHGKVMSSLGNSSAASRDFRLAISLAKPTQ